MVKMDFGGVEEDVVTRTEFTVKKAQTVLKDEIVATLGYGIQGRAQSLNMRDNGIKVIIGQEKTGFHTPYYELALKDGWIPEKTCSQWKRQPKKEQ